jgi:hypothetical protein
MVTSRYEVYAPTEESLRRGAAGVEQALSAWERYLGTPTPRVALVLYETDGQPAAVDAASFTARGLAVQVWPASNLRADMDAWGEVGAIFGEPVQGRGVVVEALYPGGIAPGVDLAAGDVVESLRGHRIRSVADFARARSGLVGGETVAMELRRAGTPRTVRFTVPRFNRAAAPRELMQELLSRRDRLPEKTTVLAHEVVHALLRARYGLLLPSWFHEGFASLAELPEVRQERWRTLRRNTAGIIPLDSLFSMRHPASRGIQLAADGAGGVAPQARARRVMVVSAGTANELFYPQSMALLEFFAEREGDRFLGQLAERLADKGRIADGLAGASKVPVDVGVLEQEFRNWVSTRSAASSRP